jgi:hypothetical protein
MVGRHRTDLDRPLGRGGERAMGGVALRAVVGRDADLLGLVRR